MSVCVAKREEFGRVGFGASCWVWDSGVESCDTYSLWDCGIAFGGFGLGLVVVGSNKNLALGGFPPGFDW